MKKVLFTMAIAAFIGGLSINTYAQDGEKKNTTTKTEKTKKCDKKKCCTKTCDTKKKKKG